MMNRIVIFVFICVLKVGCQLTYAQQIIAKQLPFLEQLSSNEIIDLHQDKEGYIWLGTSNGVERYDGYEIQTFRTNYNTPNQLSHNYITCFTEDENYLWIGTGKGLNLLNKKNYHIFRFPNKQVQEKNVNALLTDKEGNIWIAVEKELYHCHPDLSVRKTYNFYTTYLSGSGNINSLYEDLQGNIWVLTWRNGLFKYNKETDTFVKYPQIGLDDNPFAMLQDADNNYWIATWGDGMQLFYPENEPENMYHKRIIMSSKTNDPEEIFFSMVQDDTFGYLWILSYFELYALKINEKKELEKVDISHIIDKNKMFSKLTKDRDGNLWLGAYDKGYNIIFEKAKIENFLIPEIKTNIGFDTNIVALCEDRKGGIWFNQERYGLCLFNKETKQVTYGCDDNRRYSIDVGVIIPVRNADDVWAGSRYTNIIYKMGRNGMSIFIKEEINLQDITANPGNITHLQEDTNGNLWINTKNYLFIKPAHQSNVLPVDISGISCIIKDSQGNIWAATIHKDILQLKYTDKVSIINKYKNNNQMDADKIENICTDVDNHIWFSTSQGQLISLNPKTKEFVIQTGTCGLKGESIFKITTDREGIWIMTNKNLIHHNLKENRNTRYATSDENISVSSFRSKAAYVNNDGTFYAGGHGGFIAIQETAQQISTDRSNPVRITDIKAGGKSLLFEQQSPAADNSALQINLVSDNKNIEILFSSLSYVANSKIKYAYQLAGIDKDWIYIDGGKRSAFYNRLPKGNYTFNVKSTNRQGEWNDEITSLSIVMKPAYYETWYAYLLYITVFLSILYYLFKVYTNRIKLKESLKFQKELTQTKLNYFTNISHELLTPLTIISCVTDNLEMSEKPSESQLNTLQGNVNRLKRLLQQILDFRKIESGKMELNVTSKNASAFISNISRSYFQPLAEKKNIRLSVLIEEEDIEGYLDYDKVDKILFNLLSNAIKYTPEQKNIYLRIDKEIKEGHTYLTIKVTDEGIGISSKNLDRIFTRFYNNKNHEGSESNGIGLSLVKELVELHHGTIHVSSKVNKGSTFTVTLPIDKESYSESELAKATLQQENESENSNKEESSDNPTLLIVDDNEELLHLMKGIFMKNYRVFIAGNGQEGLNVLKEASPDIIICDVMMPQMDGLEFCRILKGDFNTSHIPVLMLTAKNTAEDQIECYKAGADGYIAKPFELKILHARIENLLKSCQLRRQKFRTDTEINISSLEYQSNDEQFLEKAIQCIEKHLAEPDFDIVVFASELNVSKSTLNRKMKAMAGLTPLEFIRNIRLKHACMLLKKPSVNISEVAYAVGFTNPKYFAKCFKEEFNMTPSEYQSNE